MKKPKKVSLKKIVNDTINHSKDLIIQAELAIDNAPNISYHLSTVALEEIGKAYILKFSQFEGTVDGRDFANSLLRRIDDHELKLFWAIWGNSFGTEIISGKKFLDTKQFAKNIHARRLLALYTPIDTEHYTKPKETVTKSHAKKFLNLVKARIEMENPLSTKKWPAKNRALLKWFFEINEDDDRRKLLYGPQSQAKLSELGSVPKWVEWLKKLFDDAEKESNRLLANELSKPIPEGSDLNDPKWKIRILVYTPSHSIRSNCFKEWNKTIASIQLIPNSSKKNQFYADFIFPKKIHLNSLHPHGRQMTDRFMLAFSIGGLGFFWWQMPEQKETYFHEVNDLENKSIIKLEKRDEHKIDWAHRALNDEEIKRISTVYSSLPWPSDVKSYLPFKEYLEAMVLIGKNDIYGNFSSFAFEKLHVAFFHFTVFYLKWDGKKHYSEYLKELILNFMPAFDEIEKFDAYSKSLVDKKMLPHDIVTNDVIKFKIIIDSLMLKYFSDEMPNLIAKLEEKRKEIKRNLTSR